MRIFVLALASVLLPSLVGAATFKVSFTGKVVNVVNNVGGSSVDISVDDTVTSFYKYDDGATGLAGITGTEYEITDAGLEIGRYVFEPDAASRYIRISNDRTDFMGNTIDALDFQITPDSNAYTVLSSLTDTDNSVLPDEALSNVTDLEGLFGDFEIRAGTFQAFGDAGVCDQCQISFELNAVTVMPMSAIPLPAGLGLMLGGLGIFGGLKLRRRRA